MKVVLSGDRDTLVKPDAVTFEVSLLLYLTSAFLPSLKISSLFQLCNEQVSFRKRPHFVGTYVVTDINQVV